MLPAHVVQDGQWLQCLRNAAGLSRSPWVVMFIKGQDLFKKRKLISLHDRKWFDVSASFVKICFLWLHPEMDFFTQLQVKLIRKCNGQTFGNHPRFILELIKSNQTCVVLNLRIFVFSIPDVGAGAHAVIGVVARWLVNPLPAQIFPKVNV